MTQTDVENLIRTKGAIYAAADSPGAIGRACPSPTSRRSTSPARSATGWTSPVASTIGLLPDVPLERIHFIGNSSVAGAKLVMLSRRMFDEVHRIRDRITYQELMVDPAYMEQFTSACFLPHTDLSRFPSVAERLAQTDSHARPLARTLNRGH